MKKYGIEYSDESGQLYCFNIYAKDWNDAEKRLERIKSNGRVYGEIVKEIKVGWLTFIINKLLRK